MCALSVKLMVHPGSAWKEGLPWSPAPPHPVSTERTPPRLKRPRVEQEVKPHPRPASREGASFCYLGSTTFFSGCHCPPRRQRGREAVRCQQRATTAAAVSALQTLCPYSVPKAAFGTLRRPSNYTSSHALKQGRHVPTVSCTSSISCTCRIFAARPPGRAGSPLQTSPLQCSPHFGFEPRYHRGRTNTPPPAPPPAPPPPAPSPSPAPLCWYGHAGRCAMHHLLRVHATRPTLPVASPSDFTQYFFISHPTQPWLGTIYFFFHLLYYLLHPFCPGGVIQLSLAMTEPLI